MTGKAVTVVALLAAFICAAVAPASAKTICTVVADARDGRVLHREGDCGTRVTPASTFKVALAVMGYDAGFLKDEHTPRLPFREGYPDWLGEVWRQDTDPARWLRYSVVWYSQQITRALGVDALRAYANAFSYGNADFSGDPGKDNALERAWISSSLKIAPDEQVVFLRRLVTGDLPVSRDAIDNTLRIVEAAQAGDSWTVHGKTGSAYPRLADGSFDRDRGWGWFVGWASRGDRTLVFARLNQDEQRTAGSGGLRARDAFLRGFPELAASLPR